MIVTSRCLSRGRGERKVNFTPILMGWASRGDLENLTCHPMVLTPDSHLKISTELWLELQGMAGQEKGHQGVAVLMILGRTRGVIPRDQVNAMQDHWAETTLKGQSLRMWPIRQRNPAVNDFRIQPWEERN